MSSPPTQKFPYYYICQLPVFPYYALALPHPNPCSLSYTSMWAKEREFSENIMKP